jgi:hypothetical protein
MYRSRELPARLFFYDSHLSLVHAPLDALLATCTDGLLGVRDRALLLFGWGSGGRRRSEIASATRENLTRLDPNTYVYRPGRSGRFCGVAGSAALPGNGLIDAGIFNATPCARSNS